MRNPPHSPSPAVLVVDDDPGVRRFLTKALTSAGYQVAPAMDVDSAIGCLRVFEVAAAVLDMLFVNSDGGSGLDVLRFIRSEPRLADLPVIVLTGFPLNRTVTAEVEALHAELWHKPVEASALIQRLSEVVRQRSAVG